MKSKIENCLYMQVAHCSKCGGQSGYNIYDGEKICFDCGEPYEADFHISEVESTITTTNSQDQEEEKKRIGCEYSDCYRCPKCKEELLVTCYHPLELLCTRCREYIELENVVERATYISEKKIEDMYPHLTINDNKPNSKEKVIVEVGSTLKDTPEEWEEEFMEVLETFKDEICSNFFASSKPLTDFIQQLLDEREREVLNSMREWVVEYHKDNWVIRDFDAEIAIGKIIDRELDKLNNKKK